MSRQTSPVENQQMDEEAALAFLRQSSGSEYVPNHEELTDADDDTHNSKRPHQSSESPPSAQLSVVRPKAALKRRRVTIAAAPANDAAVQADDVDESHTTKPAELKGGWKTFAAFEARLDSYCKKTFQPFYKKDAVQKISPANLAVIYKYISFRCSYYGSVRTNVTDDNRKQHGYTKKSNCKAKINVSYKDNQLQVTTVYLKHEGHDLTQTDFDAALPAVRRPTADFVRTAANFGASTSKIASEARKVFKHGTTYDDAYNVLRALPEVRQAKKAIETQPVQERLKVVCDEWQKKGVRFHRTMTDDKVMAVLALCTTEMQAAWNKFHSVLLVDATYRVNLEDYALLNVLTIGEHGHGYPVGQAFLASENEETVGAALKDIVNLLGSSYDDVRIVLTDKDWSQLAVFKTVMPNAKIYLCSWHVDQSLWQTTRQLKEKPRGKQWKLEMYLLCKKLIRARSKEDFDRVWTALVAHAGEEGKAVVEAIEKNWLNCVDQWAHFHRVNDKNYNMHTNARVERFNRIIKEIIFGRRGNRRQRQSLPEALQKMLSGLQDLLEARRLVYAYKQAKRPILLGHPVESTMTKIASIVNVSALEAILAHVKRRQINKQLILGVQNNVAIVQDNGRQKKEYVVDLEDGSCTCSWWHAFDLPCVHIVKVLHDQKSDEIVMKKFMDSHYFRGAKESTFIVCVDADKEVDSEDETLLPAEAEKTKADTRDFDRKWGESKPIAMDVTNVICNLNGKDYDDALGELKKLFNNLRKTYVEAPHERINPLAAVAETALDAGVEHDVADVAQNPTSPWTVRTLAPRPRGRPNNTQLRTNLNYGLADELITQYNIDGVLSKRRQVAENFDSVQAADEVVVEADIPAQAAVVPFVAPIVPVGDERYEDGDVIKFRFDDNTCIYQHDLDRVERQDWLYSGIVDIVSKILREVRLEEQSTSSRSLPVTGFLPVNDVWAPGTTVGQYAEHNFTTILFDVDHYIVLNHNPNRKQQRTCLLCSLGREPSENVQRQVMKLVGKQGCNLSVHMPAVSKQPGGNECGYYASMFAATLRAGDNPRQLRIDGTNRAPAKWLGERLMTRQIPKVPRLKPRATHLLAPETAKDYVIRWDDVREFVLQENVITAQDGIELV